MSAAATAAGYLYASGRLRGKNAQEHDEKAKAQRTRVAVVEPEGEANTARKPSKPAPKIQYRTRRVWKPE